MLGKLFKHDFRSLSRVLLPTQLAILCATIIATAGFAFNIRSGYYEFSGSFAISTLRVISAFISVLMLIAIIASVVLVAFIIFQRFYKSFMSDEGYLTFTLPVTTSQLLWSKLLSAALWFVISNLVIFFCMLVFIAFGTSSTDFFNAEPFQQMGAFIAEATAALGSRLVLPTIEFIIFTIIGLAYNILEIYLSIILGGVLSQKHKIWAAIGSYFGINTVVGIITSIVQTSLMTKLVFNEQFMNFDAQGAVEAFDIFFGAMNPFFLFVFGMSAVLAAGFFFLSHYLLKNKLNLE